MIEKNDLEHGVVIADHRRRSLNISETGMFVRLTVKMSVKTLSVNPLFLFLPDYSNRLMFIRHKISLDVDIKILLCKKIFQGDMFHGCATCSTQGGGRANPVAAVGGLWPVRIDRY
jgi:hypothetical protein